MQLNIELLDRFVAYLASDKGYSSRTLETYRFDLMGFVQFVNDFDRSVGWETLDADIVRRWISSRLEQGLKPATVRRGMSILRSFFRYLMLLGIVEADPTRYVKTPKMGKPLPAFIKQTEMDRLLDGDFFAPDFAGLRDRYILLLFYSTGIRLEELLRLRESDVDLQQDEITVLGKRKKQRIIPMTEELVRETDNYICAKQNHFGNFAADALVVNNKGAAISKVAVYNTVRHYLFLVTSQTKRSPHVLRHTFATVMLNNGADLEAVKELLGHESLATTEIYTHTTFTQLQKEYKQAHPRGDEHNP